MVTIGRVERDHELTRCSCNRPDQTRDTADQALISSLLKRMATARAADDSGGLATALPGYRGRVPVGLSPAGAR